MKKSIHPEDYRLVVFRDTSNDTSFLTRSTAPSTSKVKWEDGKEYPVVDVHISSTSHPFYTGKEKLVDIEGRVDRFKAKQERAQKLREEAAKSRSAKKVKLKSKQPKSAKQ